MNFVQFLTGAQRSNVMSALRDRTAQLNEAGLRNLLKHLMRLAETDEIEVRDQSSTEAFTVEDLAFIAESVLSELDVKGVALEAFKEAEEATNAVALPSTIVSKEAMVQDGLLNGYWSSQAELTEETAKWTKRLTDMVEDQSIYDHPKGRVLLLAWNRLVSEEAWKAHLEQVYADPKLLAKDMEVFWAVPTGPQQVSPIDQRDPRQEAVLALDRSLLGPNGRAIQDSYRQGWEQYFLVERVMKRRRR